jgi:hypothetical protein
MVILCVINGVEDDVEGLCRNHKDEPETKLDAFKNCLEDGQYATEREKSEKGTAIIT